MGAPCCEGSGKRVKSVNRGQYNVAQSTERHHALQHGHRIVTRDYSDVTSPYVYEPAILRTAISAKRAFPMLRYFSLSMSTSARSPQVTDRNE